MGIHLRSFFAQSGRAIASIASPSLLQVPLDILSLIFWGSLFGYAVGVLPLPAHVKRVLRSVTTAPAPAGKRSTPSVVGLSDAAQFLVLFDEVVERCLLHCHVCHCDLIPPIN